MHENGPVTTSAVQIANTRAARWFEAVLAPGRSSVFSPVGVWPLLAMLAAGADGPARRELEDAVGLPADDAAEAACDLVAELRGMSGVSAALGLWTAATVAVHPQWVRDLPPAAVETLAADPAESQRRLDAWAAAASGGRIPTMPAGIDADTLLVLASGVTVATRWLHPFADAVARPSQGPWAGREVESLARTTTMLDQAAVLEGPCGPVTELRVRGEGEIDVHLLLGESGATPGNVLGTGIAVLHRPEGPRPTIERITADVLPTGDAGPGMSISRQRSQQTTPTLRVSLARFDLDAAHDLLGHAEAFGLAAASDARTGHFPGIASFPPLAVGSARQDAVATFSADGFEAAAVTAMTTWMAGAAMGQPALRRRVEIDFHRPFAFLAVHRTSRLVLAGGWVAEPQDAGSLG